MIPTSPQSHVIIGNLFRQAPDPGSRVAEFLAIGLHRVWVASIVDIVDMHDGILAGAKRDPLITRAFLENVEHRISGLQRREVSYCAPADPRSLMIFDKVFAQALATPPTILNINYTCIDVYQQWLAKAWDMPRDGLGNLAFWVVSPPSTGLDGQFSHTLDVILEIRAKFPESRIILFGDFLAGDTIQAEIERLQIRPVDRLDTTMEAVRHASANTALTIEQILSMARWAESVVADVAKLLRTHPAAQASLPTDPGSVVRLRPSTAPPRPRLDPTSNVHPQVRDIAGTQVRPPRTRGK